MSLCVSSSHLTLVLTMLDFKDKPLRIKKKKPCKLSQSYIDN